MEFFAYLFGAGMIAIVVMIVILGAGIFLGACFAVLIALYRIVIAPFVSQKNV